MCGLPGSGIEPVSPALAGEFFTTKPPGKPGIFFYSSHPSACQVVSHCDFNLHFPDD